MYVIREIEIQMQFRFPLNSVFISIAWRKTQILSPKFSTNVCVWKRCVSFRAKVPKTSIWSNALSFPKKNALNFDPREQMRHCMHRPKNICSWVKPFPVNANLHLICKQKCVCYPGNWNTNAISFSFELGFWFFSLATRSVLNIWISRIQHVLNLWM